MPETRDQRLRRLQGAYEAWEGHTAQNPDDYHATAEEERILTEYQAADPTPEDRLAASIAQLQKAVRHSSR